MSDKEYEIWFSYHPHEWPFCWEVHMSLPGHRQYNGDAITRWGAKLAAWHVRRAWRRAERMRKRGRL